MTTPVAFRAQEELDNIREYFEDRQDASMEPGEDRFHGNKEMSLLQDLEKVEKSIKALCNAISEASSAYAILAESKGLNATDPMAHAAAILRAERDEAMKYAGRRFVEGMKYAQELLRTNGFEKSALALDHEIARAALAKGVERDENGCIQYERQIGEDAKPGNEIGAFKEWFLRWGAEKERRPISTDWFGYRDLQAAFEAGQKLHSISAPFDVSKVDRVEVINHISGAGREYVARFNGALSISMQDDDRTLKLFIEPMQGHSQ